MNLTFSDADLREIVVPIVAEVVASVQSHPLDSNEQLAYLEPDAAKILGIASHQLRDARLRGEIVSTKVGGRIGYERSELIAYLVRGRSKG